MLKGSVPEKDLSLFNPVIKKTIKNNYQLLVILQMIAINLLNLFLSKYS